LKVWLERMREEGCETGGRLDPGFILINSFFEGYRSVYANMGDAVNRLIFDESTMGQHQRYVGQEGSAVYVRDMELHYPVDWLGERVEVADCQGSDSPNPLHLELLQQYLLGAHFILYVVSSRTGLREADFKLIDFIKTLRMLPQTFFIVNADLDGHPDREDLDRLAERVRTELAWVAPDPQVFTFSALYHLTDQLGENAPDRERKRLELWKGEEALSRLTEEGFSTFRDQLVRRIGDQRARILLATGLSRLAMVAGSIMDTAGAQKSFLAQDLDHLKKSSGRLKDQHKALHGTLSTLQNAIFGLRDTVRGELDESVDRYFAANEGVIVKETLDMVDCYPIDSKYEDLGDHRKFVRGFYQFYIEFRQTLSRYLVERVNLRIIEFAKQEEHFLEARFVSSSAAFWSLFAKALEDYRAEMAQFHVDLRTAGGEQGCEWSPSERATPPSFSAFVDHDALGRGILLMKFGLGRFTRFLTGIKARIGSKDKDLLQWKRQGDETIREAVSLVKSEARAELVGAFRNYARSFKSAYLYRMLDEVTVRLMEDFRVRAEMTQLDFANLLRQSELKGEERVAMLDLLDRTLQVTGGMMDELDGLRCAVNLDRLPPEASPEAAEQ
ncbi:MAG: hypothetical protein ACLGPL_09120, partial [Acidobacteriota bacterium]